MNGRRYALVAGGGTAGHLQPALAIAEALVSRGHDRSTIEFVGSSRGQDRVALAGRGFPVTLLPGRGIARSMRPRVVLQNLAALAALAVAAARALAVVGRARPRVVVSVGGYASVAAAAAAVVWGVPLVLVNVDAVPGAANRLFGRVARASAVGWAGCQLPRAVVTGTPVRPEIATVDRGGDARLAARTALGLPTDRPTVAVFGGSLGARRINDAVVDLARRWAGRPDRSIYHIVGRRDWEAVDGAAEGLADGAAEGLADGAAEGLADGAAEGLADQGAVVRVPYEERMALVYAAADVVVCRAGAMTVAELAVAGVPAVLVPLPGAPGDHQTANARVLERAGAAVLLPDPACTGERLAAILDPLLDEVSPGSPPGPVGSGKLDAMGRAAAQMGRPDAADAGARVVEESAKPGEMRG